MSEAEQIARAIVRALRDARFEAYWAGGAVRDRLRGIEPEDFDIATSARPEEVLQLFPDSKAVGAHFGVVVVPRRGIHTEVATFRIDGDYSDGRRPDRVTYATAREDAERRDFTVNGLFYDPIDERVIDHVGGLEDLETRTLRAIGDPARRFDEDKLRLLRAVRFATTLDFEIEPATWEALVARAEDVDIVSPERIAQELDKIWRSSRRLPGFDLLDRSGLLDVILPEMGALRGCEQPPEWHPEGDVFVHTRLLLEHLPSDASVELVWAALLHDIAKPETRSVDPDGRVRFNGHDARGAEVAESVLRRLRYSNRTIDAVSEMVARHMHFINVPQMRRATLRRFLGRPHFADELALHYADCSASHGNLDTYDYVRGKLAEFANEPVLPPPLLTGRDLLALGWSPGPAIGEMLRQVQTLQLDGELADRAEALRYVEQAGPTPAVESPPSDPEPEV